MTHVIVSTFYSVPRCDIARPIAAKLTFLLSNHRQILDSQQTMSREAPEDPLVARQVGEYLGSAVLSRIVLGGENSLAPRLFRVAVLAIFILNLLARGLLVD